jgi:membrane-associated phospholipid phosphatase
MTLRAEKLIVAVTLGALLHPAFQAIAAWARAHSVPAPWWMDTPLDRALPLVPAAVWAYVSWYPASLVLFFAGRQTLRRAYVSYLIAFAICLMCYAAFPVAIGRPSLLGTDGLSAALLATLYANDLPVNLLPSLHAAVATVLFRLRPASAAPGALVAVWAAAVCVSCVLTKQHYVADVVAGALLGGAALRAADWALRHARRRQAESDVMLAAIPGADG